MLVLRVILIAGVLFLVGIGIAFAFTRDRKYLRLAWRVAQGLLVLLVAAGLVYVFSRVLLL
jgi:hypothetical protein